MIISFRPISFHCSSTACEGLGAGFGGSFFVASCATAGSTTNPVANTNPATHLSFFIFSLLRYAPTRSGRSFLQTRHSATRFPPVGPISRDQHCTRLRYLAFRGGFILRSKMAPVMRNSQPPRGKIVFHTLGALT